MGKSTKLKESIEAATTQVAGDPCLIHIYPKGPQMGSRYILTDISLILGRDPACDLTIDDITISRFHVRVQPTARGCEVVDLKSTNGTFVNEVRIASQMLNDGDYLRIGNNIFRYLAGGNLESQYHEEIYRLTIVDALTAIHNNRYLLEFLNHELARSTRLARPLALAMFDLDRFKLINDRLGHLGGDYTLRALADCVQAEVRREDLFARYGGEEFALVMTETSREPALERAERLRELVEKHPFVFEGEAFPVTISVGVACAAGEQAPSVVELIGQADANMYAAKNAGRNRVVG